MIANDEIYEDETGYTFLVNKRINLISEKIAILRKEIVTIH